MFTLLKPPSAAKSRLSAMGRPLSTAGPTGRYSELAAWALDPMRAAAVPSSPPPTYSPESAKACLCTRCVAAPRMRPAAPASVAAAPVEEPMREPQVADYLRFLRTPRWQTGNLPCFLSRDVDTWTQDRLALTCALRARGLPLPYETLKAQSLDTPELKKALLPAALLTHFDLLLPDTLRGEFERIRGRKWRSSPLIADTALHIARYPYMFDCQPLELNPVFKG